MSIGPSHLEELVEDDELMESAAQRLMEPDPEASPAVNKARLRFNAGIVRTALRAVATALEARA